VGGRESRARGRIRADGVSKGLCRSRR
jgi:hypothetical protein